MNVRHGLRPDQFCARILNLMSGSNRDSFEFFKDSPEGKFLQIFRSRQYGDYDTVIENRSRYRIWKFQDRVRMVISNITVEVDRKSLIGVLNKNIEDANDYLISKYQENAILLHKVTDPIKVKKIFA